MARISLAEASRGTEGVLVRGDGRSTVESFSIDTRTLKGGDLFFALVGPSHDAHAFVPEAIRKGAAAVVISRGGTDEFPGASAIIRVPDTTRALQDLGRRIRKRQPVRVVGITGSTGKTTTKEMTAAVMEEAMPTFKSTGNLNNLYGLPLSLLALEPHHRCAVLEMGMSYAGELARLAEIADPDVGVLTNVYPVHQEHFPSLSAIGDAKGELFRGMRMDAIAVFNADDPEATRVARPFPGRKIGFGFSGKAEVRAREIDSLPSGDTRFRLMAPGVDGEAIRKGLVRTKPLPMRGALLRLKGEVRILDETYNSNPRAMERTLETLSSMTARRKVVAAGDMLELGPLEKEAHRILGQQVAGAGAELFLAVGPLSELAAASAREGGVPEVRHFPDSASAAAWLAAAVRPGDLILVKGSRGIAMERIVEAIRAILGREET